MHFIPTSVQRYRLSFQTDIASSSLSAHQSSECPFCLQFTLKYSVILSPKVVVSISVSEPQKGQGNAHTIIILDHRSIIF